MTEVSSLAGTDVSDNSGIGSFNLDIEDVRSNVFTLTLLFRIVYFPLRVLRQRLKYDT